MEMHNTAIIIATKNRPQILADTLQSSKRQTCRAAWVYVSTSSLEGAPPAGATEGVIVLVGSPGGRAQRNSVIRHVPFDAKYIAFFDDDIELHPSYLEQGVSFVERKSGVFVISGTMLADGNISREAARTLLEQDTTWESSPSLRPHHILYACNAVVRSDHLPETLFDEHLPLYSYGEDYDLCLRLKKFGRVGRLSNAVGVHLKAPSARISGKRDGLRRYS